MTAERWLPVVGYEGLYEVSDLGRVRSLPRIDSRKIPRGGHVMKPAIDIQTGYVSYGLRKDGKLKRIAAHTLVLTAFVGPRPPGMECLHGDDDRASPALANLEWGPRQQNAADRAARGRAARGEANGGGGKLTEKDVRAIRALTGKAKGSDVGRQFGVKKEMIYAIWKGKTWRHVT